MTTAAVSIPDTSAQASWCTFGPQPVTHETWVKQLLRDWAMDDLYPVGVLTYASLADPPQVRTRGCFVNPNRLVGFYKFMFDRHNIWHKRFVQQLPAPWTADPVLAKWKFTNVYRELDRGTVYLLSWLDEGAHTAETLLWNIMAYRLFNNWESHAALGGFSRYGEFDYHSWYKALRARWQGNKTVLSTAHNTCVYTGFPGKDKVERVCLIAKRVHARIPQLLVELHRAASLEEVFKVIRSVPGYGPFLAYEVVTDLTYTDLIPYSVEDWANPGPGAIHGLEHIFYLDGNKASLVDLMRHLRDEQDHYFSLVKQVFGPDYDFAAIRWNGRPLDLRCIEHSLCEFSKIIKLYKGTGRNFSGHFKLVDRGQRDFNKMRS